MSYKGFHVKAVTWDNDEYPIAEVIRLTSYDSKVLVLKHERQCCEDSYFGVKDLHNLIDEVIVNIDLEDEELEVETIDMGEDAADYDKVTYEGDKLAVFKSDNDCINSKLYIIKTLSGKRISLPLVVIGNTYYDGYLTWSYE